MMQYQQTLAGPVSFRGMGLHTGVRATVHVLPAPPDSGVVFRRTDTGAVIPARVDRVVETAYATVLGRGDAGVSTVEHFLAALYGLEIDNAFIDVDGPELPILDGSALPIVREITARGVAGQPVRRRFLRVLETRRIHRNGSLVTLGPSDDLEILMAVDFPGTVIGKQWYKFIASSGIFTDQIAPARTFVLREQIEGLWKIGLAKGGSLDNAIVVEGDKIHNFEGLRFDDEFVRHKLLDFLGDLALLGRPVQGSFLAIRPGHTVNRCLVEHLFGLPTAGAREMPASLMADGVYLPAPGR